MVSAPTSRLTVLPEDFLAPLKVKEYLNKNRSGDTSIYLKKKLILFRLSL